MTVSKFVLAGVAALALTACGEKESDSTAPTTQSSQQAARADAASPLDAEFRLKDAEPIDVDSLFALMPADSRPTYESAAFDSALGATVISGLRFADNDDGESVVVERAEFYGVDLEAIDRVKNAADPAVDAPFETVLQKVRFLNVKTEGFDQEETSITIGGIEIDGLSIRQGGVEGNGEGDEGARFFNAVNLAGLYFKDVSMNAESADAPLFALSAPDIRIVGVGGGKLDAVIANDLEYTVTQSPETLEAMNDVMGPQAALLMSGPLKNILAPDNQRTALKVFEWRGVDMSGLLDWGLKGETPPMEADNLIDLGEITARDVESFIAGRRVATVEEVTMTEGGFTWLAPSSIRIDTKGAVYDLTAYVPETEEAALKALRDNGLDQVNGDGYMEWRWNDNSGAANLDYVATTDGLADFSMALDLSGLKLKEIAKATEEGEAKPVAALGKLNNFTLSLTDEKALDAIFALAALQMGGSPEDLRVSAPAMIRLSGAQFAQMNARLPDYIDAVADFVAKGGTLEISANPEEPLAFSALQGAGAAPQDLPDTINLTVTHKE